ncbi:MAG TPA: sugar phosphate isomerase/epimerase family protein [Gammaproteobacteria bacterium]
MQNRRQFIESAAAAGLTLGAGPIGAQRSADASLFSISLAQWSLNRMLFAGELDALDFPAFAKSTFGIDAVEYVNQFFMDKARDRIWLAELKKRCDDNGVKSLLIMCDREGNLGDPEPARRAEAVENHVKWLEAAEFLGCHSVRVNAASSGTYEEQRGYATAGLRRLSELGAEQGLNVIVENHGGLSSNGKWLAEVITAVGRDNCGTLPDFGNFYVTRDELYDRYQGVAELMPFAKGVSAKSYGFDAMGNETTIDYRRMLEIVLDAGYRGHVGVEWEGREIPEVEGVRLTKALLERVRDELMGQYAV